MAEVMLEDTISDEEVSKHREKYSLLKSPSETDQFQFALTLIRSKQKTLIEEGLYLYQNLFTKTTDEDVKRDSLYYMAIAQTKLSNYEHALKYLHTILNVQPNNDQVKELIAEVNKRIKRDGLIGIGIAGSAAFVGFLGLVGLGTALVFSKKK